MAEPTAGAMRAAQKIVDDMMTGSSVPTMSGLWRALRREKAAIIDAETGLPELIAACEGLLGLQLFVPCLRCGGEGWVEIVEHIEDRFPQRDDCPECHGAKEVEAEEAQIARTALAKAKGESSG